MTDPALPDETGEASERLALLQSAFDTAETIILALNREGVVTKINRYGASLLGQPVEAIVGRNWFDDFLPQPEGHDTVLAAFRQALADGSDSVDHFENDILVADGSRRTVAWHNTWIRDAAGDIAGSLSTGNDITAYKRMEATLRHSLDDLHRAQAIGRIGSWRLDGNGDQLVWSPETCRIFGAAPGKPMSYGSFLERVHPDDRAYVEARWQAALAGEAYDVEHRIVVGRRIRWIRERAELEFDAEGRLLSAHGTAQDVTERKLAAQALMENEEWLLQAQEIGHIGVYDYDIRTDRWYGSAVLDTIFGIDRGHPKTVAGWLALTHPDDHARMASYLEDVASGAIRSFDNIYRIRRAADGAERWLHGYGRIEHDADGRPVRMIGVIIDITGQKQVELARDEANRRNRRMFLDNPLPMWVFDMETLRFLDVNAAAVRQYGYSREAFLAMRLLDLKPPEEHDASVERSGPGGRGSHGDIWRHIRKDGSVIDAAVWSELIDFEGRPARLAICQDVTLQRELATANRQRLELAARLDVIREEERTRIGRELHDELGQMITAVKMHLRRFISRTQYFDRTMAMEMVDVARMLDDSNDVVRRIAQELRPQVLDTLDLAGAVAWEVGAFRKRMGIRCDYSGPAAEPSVPDKSRVHIYRILQEALTNISRHTMATHVSVRLHHAGGELVLAIEDNGHGIPRAALAAPTLGLTGMKERATLIGGSLTIDTRPDIDGTRLTLRVPIGIAGKSAGT